MNVNKIMMLCLLSCICMSSQAQSDEEIRRFTVGNYEFGLRADGRLFVSDDERPGLQTIDGVSLMNGMDFMITGLDPSGNYKTSGYMPTLQDGLLSESQSGAIDYATGEVVLKDYFYVSGEEIAAHYLDYKEDGIINDTIDNILYWPANGNIHAEQKYGVLPSDYTTRLPFKDINNNGIYEPLLGDYPILENDVIPEDFVVKFYSTKPDNSLGVRSNFTVSIFAVSCGDEDANVDDVLYVDWQFINAADYDVRKSSTILSMDIALGNQDDEFMAYDTTSNSLHIYADPSSEDKDVLSVYAYDPYRVFENNMLEFKFPDRAFHFDVEGLLAGPNTLQDLFQRFIESKWNDGSSRSYGGNGYPDPNAEPVPASFMYTGAPGDSQSWNEISAGNIAGKRNAAILLDIGLVQPSQVVRRRYAISHASNSDGLPDFSYAAQQSHDIGSIFRLDVGLECPLLEWLSTTQEQKISTFEIYPNPASGSIYFESDYTFQKVMIYDMMGRHIHTIQDPVSPFDFHPSGMYLLRFYDESGMVQQKLLHSVSY